MSTPIPSSEVTKALIAKLIEDGQWEELREGKTNKGHPLIDCMTAKQLRNACVVNGVEPFLLFFIKKSLHQGVKSRAKSLVGRK